MPKQQQLVVMSSRSRIKKIQKITDDRGVITLCKLIGTPEKIAFFLKENPPGPKIEEFLTMVNSKDPRYRVGENNDHIIPIFHLKWERTKRPDGSPSLHIHAHFQ